MSKEESLGTSLFKTLAYMMLSRTVSPSTGYVSELQEAVKLRSTSKSFGNLQDSVEDN